jgi:hypothetical protein
LDRSASVHQVCDQSLADISRQSRIAQPPKTGTSDKYRPSGSLGKPRPVTGYRTAFCRT